MTSLAAAREEKFPAVVTQATTGATLHADLLRAAGFSPTTESGLCRLVLGTAD